MNKTLSKISKAISKKDLFVMQSAGMHLSMPNRRVLNLKTMNQNVYHMEYAVRGPVVLRAGAIEDELHKGVQKPFDQVIRANIGDCHATGQKPITFFRQYMALCTLPELLKDPNFPNDVKERARRFLNDCKGLSVGSYTESEGLKTVRQDVAKFIEERDEGIPCDWQNIHLTTGASDAIKSIMEILITNRGQKKAGFMIPIPQYPFYTATIREFDALPVRNIKAFLHKGYIIKIK
jgi:alanine transaminase